MKINVLITSASRKVWLVKAFKNAFKIAGLNGRVITVDKNPLSAGLYFSDGHYTVPPSSNPKFISILLDICMKEDIGLLIPTRDAELLFFAKNRNDFLDMGIKIMISDEKVIEICVDKYKFYQFLNKNNISTPNTYLPYQIKDTTLKPPLIIKPRFGSGAKGIFKIKDKNELNFFLNYVSEPIIQEFIEGKEYTIDLFSDFSGKILTIVPRERIEVFCGESYKGKTVKDTQIMKSIKELAEKLVFIGHVTIQCIKNENEIKFIEINPRFGGGAMLGFEAGANTPLLLIKLILGDKIEPKIGEFRENLIMLRYTRDIFLLNEKVIDDK